MPSPATRCRRSTGCSSSTSVPTTMQLPGLKRLVEENLDEIDAAEINTFPLGHDPDGNEIVVKPGQVRTVRAARRRHRRRSRRHGPRRAHRRQGARAARRAEGRRADRSPRRAPRLRQERTVRAVRAVGRCRRPAAWLRQAEDVEPVQDDDARADGPGAGHRAAVVAASGRQRSRRRCRHHRSERPFGPYVSKGKESRSLQNEEQLLTVTLDDALALLAQPRQFRRPRWCGAQAAAARVRHRPGQRPACGRQRWQLRRLRHRR